jgi:hypothetical protein
MEHLLEKYLSSEILNSSKPLEELVDMARKNQECFSARVDKSLEGFNHRDAEYCDTCEHGGQQPPFFANNKTHIGFFYCALKGKAISNPKVVSCGNYKVQIKRPGNIGAKHDSDKPRMDLLPFDALIKVAEVLGMGAAKYGENNWRGVARKRYEAALLRHYTAYKNGEKKDQESGLSHLSHMACNALFILALEDR